MQAFSKTNNDIIFKKYIHGSDFVPGKASLIVTGIFLLFAVDLLVTIITNSNHQLERILWAILSILATVSFSVKLKRPTEARWGIVLVLVCLTLPYVVSITVGSYSMWAYYRWQRRNLLIANQIVASEVKTSSDNLQHFFAGVRLRYFFPWFVFSIISAIFASVSIAHFWFKSKDILLIWNMTYLIDTGLLLFWVLGKTEKYDLGFGRLFGAFPKNYLLSQIIFLLVFLGLFCAGSKLLVLYSESFVFP